MRFNRSLDVVRQLLGLQQTLPTETEEKLRVTMEARAVRPWEEFDEGIIGWWQHVLQPAVVGQFSGVFLGVGSEAGLSPAPRTRIVVLDSVAVDDNAADYQIRRSEGTTLGAGATLNAVPTDSRWGGSAVALQSVFLGRGSGAALDGALVEIFGNGASALPRTPLASLPLIVHGGDAPQPLILVYKATVNTALSVTLRGRLVNLRQK